MESLTAITDAKIEKYLDTTRRAMEKVKIVVPDKSHLDTVAQDFMRMASSYYADAQHFHEVGDYVNAFACVNYAHGWLDCGARLGLFDVGHDDVLFTLAQ